MCGARYYLIEIVLCAVSSTNVLIVSYIMLRSHQFLLVINWTPYNDQVSYCFEGMVWHDSSYLNMRHLCLYQEYIWINRFQEYKD